MQLFGLRQVDSVAARAVLARDEADVAPEWVLEVDAVTEAQVCGTSIKQGPQRLLLQRDQHWLCSQAVQLSAPPSVIKGL